MVMHSFTSESVSEGHPDKVADQISDAIVDAILRQDRSARIACETLVKTGMVMLAGEIQTSSWVDFESLVRGVIRQIGYTDPEMGFDDASCAVLSSIGKQSEDIAQGVDRDLENLGAGDQGLMFGYAVDTTENFMPLPINLANRLMRQQALVRKSGVLPWLRPDAKSQVTVRYEDDRPVAVDTIVVSTQHAPGVSHAAIVEAVIEEIIKPVIPEAMLSETQYLINPTGRFVIGGPQGDCGLTGRKIIVDTYGGMARHGGGCFSGKDPSKVDRSGAYAARYVAKHIVAAGLAKRCEVQISYAIGVAEPVAIHVETFGTGILPEEQIVKRIRACFDLRPTQIIESLDLLSQSYLPLAAYGHFGRDDVHPAWERLDRLDALK